MSSIEQYLKAIPDGRRRALQDLRTKILTVIPAAQECISYRIPAFRLDGVVVAGFCATAKGCSYFPFSGATLQTLAPDLTRFSQTKSSLHFQADRPLSASLVRKLIKTRIQEIRDR